MKPMKKARKHLNGLSLVLMALVCVIGLSLFFSISAAADTNVPVPMVTVTDLDAPVIGELPDTEVTVNGALEVTKVAWTYLTGDYYSKWDSSRPFEQGTTYRATISVKGKNGLDISIQHDSMVTVNGKQSEYIQYMDNELSVYADFKTDSYLSTLYASGLTVPAIGAIPDTSVDPGRVSYTASVTWFNRNTDEDHPSDQPFEANTSYSARVTFTAKDGYSFKAGVTPTVYVNGSLISGLSFNGTKQVTAYVYYDLGPAAVESVRVNVAPPMPGSAPDLSPEVTGDGFLRDYDGDGYTNGIKWVDTETGKTLTAEDSFIGGRSYTVYACIQAKDGYGFTSGPKTIFIGKNLAYEEPSSNTHHRFYETTFVAPLEIDKIIISDLAEPADGRTPDKSVLSETAGVRIEEMTWGRYTVEGTSSKIVPMAEGETFRDGETYLLTLYIKADGTRVFATKISSVDASRRYAITPAYVNGEKCTLLDWDEHGEDGVLAQKDPYTYATILLWFTPESEKLTEISGKIDNPIGGQTPATSATVFGDGVTVESVVWSVYHEYDNGAKALILLRDGEKFEDGKTYVANIKIATVGNTTFAYNEEGGYYSMSATVNGKRAQVVGRNAQENADPYHKATVSVWLKCNGSIITSVDIAGIIPPVAGELPSYDRTVNGNGYDAFGTGNANYDGSYSKKNGIAWYDVTNGGFENVYDNQPFVGGRTYEVRISLQVSENYLFAVDGDSVTTVVGEINGMTAEVTALPAYSNQQFYVLVKLTFECEEKTINSVNINIPEPIVGEKPSWEMAEGDFGFTSTAADDSTAFVKNGIAWSVYGEKDAIDYNSEYTFLENTEYELVMLIAINEGYVIEDADSFEVYVNGLYAFNKAVLPASGQIVVSYIFEKTPCTHSIVPVEKVPATCELDGMEAHFKCEKCGLTYKDALGEEPLDEGEIWGIIPATGHNFGDWTPSKENPGFHVGKCDCGATVEYMCDYEATFIEGPSKYSKYNGTLFSCPDCGAEGSFCVDETSCDHELGEWHADESRGGTHYRTCECTKVYEEQNCDFAITVEKAPSEYSDIRDVYLYTCKKCGSKHIEPIEGENTETKESVTDEETNVTVEVPENSETFLPEGTTVTATPVETDDIPEGAKDMMEDSLGGKVDVVGGYDIILYYKDVEIQPFASVSVTIPLGKDVEKSDDMIIAHYDDYSITPVQTVIFDWETGTATFETDHFSKYLIIRLTPNPSDPERPADVPNADNNGDNDGLGTGAIVAIVIGAILVVGLGSYAIYRFVNKKKEQ